MNEGASLAPGSMNGERVADGGLHQEAVQHRAVIAVVIEAIGEPRVAVWAGVGSPDDALVQVGDADLVVLVVVEEEQLIERLRHVIDAARAGGVEDFLFEAAAVGLRRLPRGGPRGWWRRGGSHSRRRPWCPDAPRGCLDRFQRWRPAGCGCR